MVGVCFFCESASKLVTVSLLGGGRASSGDVPIRGARRIRNAVVETIESGLYTYPLPLQLWGGPMRRWWRRRGLQTTLAGEPLVEGQLVPLVPSARVRPCAREWRCAHALAGGGKRHTTTTTTDDDRRRRHAQAAGSRGLTTEQPGGANCHTAVSRDGRDDGRRRRQTTRGTHSSTRQRERSRRDARCPEMQRYTRTYAVEMKKR